MGFIDDANDAAVANKIVDKVAMFVRPRFMVMVGLRGMVHVMAGRFVVADV